MPRYVFFPSCCTTAMVCGSYPVSSQDISGVRITGIDSVSGCFQSSTNGRCVQKGDLLDAFEVFVESSAMLASSARCGGVHSPDWQWGRGSATVHCDPPLVGRYVSIRANFSVPTSLILCEVEVFSPTDAVCGDGYRAASEECDDGNLYELDGCSPLCVVETHFECKGGNVTAPDVCYRTVLPLSFPFPPFILLAGATSFKNHTLLSPQR